MSDVLLLLGLATAAIWLYRSSQQRRGAQEEMQRGLADLQDETSKLRDRLAYTEHHVRELMDWIAANVVQGAPPRAGEPGERSESSEPPTEQVLPAEAADGATPHEQAEPSQGVDAPEVPQVRAPEPSHSVDVPEALQAPAPEPAEDAVASPRVQHTQEVSSDESQVAAFRRDTRAPADRGDGHVPSPEISPRGLHELLLGGNTVVRVGLFVLLVGVTLLLKYAAEHSLFPIELRMASAGLIGMALVGVGLRHRETRPTFARTLQGGGVATMYLVVFFSFRTYELLPSGLAFALLATIAASSAVLAVVQNAMTLIVIGQVGGFLAPILASTGGGSHVALFSYYLLLNLAITGVAWFRAWRLLNLVGFVFTFGIGTAWGVLRYEPEYLASTEPYLVAFFLLYVAIPVLFAWRAQVRGWADGSLVFGAPLAFLALQLQIVRDIPFAMAFTTLGTAALYLGLAFILSRSAANVLHTLRESFLALGVGFGTLAIPYGLDNSGLTGATWAIEGAGLYFIGVRQQRGLSRVAGVLLQCAAGIALIVHALDPYPDGALPVLNARVFGALLLAFGSLFIARHAYEHRESLGGDEAKVLQGLIGWALVFIVPTAVVEIDRHVPGSFAPGALVLVAGALALLFEEAGHRLSWPGVRYVAACAGGLFGLTVLVWEVDLGEDLLSHGGVFGWPVYLAALGVSLWRFVPVAAKAFRALHLLALFGTTFWVALELYHLSADHLLLGDGWAWAAFGFAPVFALWVLILGAKSARWPLSVERTLYFGFGRSALAFVILGFSLLANVEQGGDTEPLPYVPLMNPLELTQLFGFMAVLTLCRHRRNAGSAEGDRVGILPELLWGSAFFAWNALLARTAHHFQNVPWDFGALWRSVAFQAAVTLSWTLIGLLLTVRASRSARRKLWVIGACLLGVVVVKLFAVDLARLSTPAKIGTFLIVGVLLLLVGYFAPVPPARSESNQDRAPE